MVNNNATVEEGVSEENFPSELADVMKCPIAEGFVSEKSEFWRVIVAP